MAGGGVVLTVFGLLALHAVEMTSYAALYHWLGQFKDFETSLYFSGTTFTTLGYGDIALGSDHRLLAAGQCLIGQILIGWSTARLVAVTTRLLAMMRLKRRSRRTRRRRQGICLDRGRSIVTLPSRNLGCRGSVCSRKS